MKNNENFEFEAYEFLSGLIEKSKNISIELSKICSSNYRERFINVRDTINRLSTITTKFIDKWGNDEYNICNTLKTIREYYGYYCVTLSESSPSLCTRDSKYIMDSIETYRLTLSTKLSKLKNSF